MSHGVVPKDLSLPLQAAAEPPLEEGGSGTPFGTPFGQLRADSANLNRGGQQQQESLRLRIHPEQLQAAEAPWSVPEEEPWRMPQAVLRPPERVTADPATHTSLEIQLPATAAAAASSAPTSPASERHGATPLAWWAQPSEAEALEASRPSPDAAQRLSPWQLANRHFGPMQRLRDHQGAWRRQHDRLMRKKTQEVEETGQKGEQGRAWPSESSSNCSEDSMSTVGEEPRLSPRASMLPLFKRSVLSVKIINAFRGTRQSVAETGAEELEAAHGGPDDSGNETRLAQVREDRRQEKEGEITEFLDMMEIRRRRGSASSRATQHRSRGRSLLLRSGTADTLEGGSPQPQPSDSPDVLLHKMAARRPDEVDAIRLARKYRLQVWEVRDCLREFNRLDLDGRGVLTREQFLDAVRSHVAVEDPDAVPEIPEENMNDVLQTMDVDGRRTIDFEEYVAWTQIVAFTKDTAHADPAEQNIRMLAKLHHLSILDVEYIWREFVKYDSDKSGSIMKAEFLSLLRTLLHAEDESQIPKATLDRFWFDADTSGDGSICFSEFLTWYSKYFLGGQDDESRFRNCPVSNVYRRLGHDRLDNFYCQA
mmetsp:Transcript_65355/g.202614  ORF Transcript_65355/g.202614 Transcript_65355/m.202614 type:complete len:594 (+) Transcript_65355:80-1861(+)